MSWSDDAHLAFDFETSGAPSPEDDTAKNERKFALQPWRVRDGQFWATSLVWCQKKANAMRIEGGLNPTRDMMAAMLEHAIKERRRIVGWNTVFDISVLLAYDLEELVWKCKWLDGMLLWKHFFLEPEYEAKLGKRKSYGLKPCVEEHLSKFAGYEEDVDFHDPSPEARDKLHRYNVRDTIFTLRLAKKWWDKLTPQQRRCAVIDAASLPMIARANLHGMPVDMLASAELRQYQANVAADKLERLQFCGVTEKIVRSPIQLGKLMFDDWGLKVLKENKSKLTGNVTRSTDKEVLHELSFEDPRIKELREYREALNGKTKFADAVYKSAVYNGDGCVHPLAIPFGTYSGRLTYASKQGKGVKAVPIGFAIHQAPGGRSDPKVRVRGQIVAPEGYSLLEFDASGQEYRWMAIASMDENMLQMCLPGEDGHSYLGARIAEIDYRLLMARLKHVDEELKKAAEMDRKLGKVGNLSLQYRTSAPKLRSIARVDYNIPMEMPQARIIHATYPKTYPRVPLYWKSQIDLVKRLGYVETFGGRRVQVVGNWAGDWGWAMGSTAINYRIQGTGACQKYLALAVIKDYIRSIRAYFAWDLHDGIYLWVPDDKLQEAAATIKPTLDHLPYKKAWGFEPPIPLPWDCKAGGSWGTLKEYHP